MTEEEFETMVADALSMATSAVEDASIAELEDAYVSTFEDDGVLTTNRGLVIRLADQSEFQMTIVRSR